jgi:hypothetical protein
MIKQPASAMNNSPTRLDLTEIFCNVDDFYQVFNRRGEAIPQLHYDGQARSYRSKLSFSEVLYQKLVVFCLKA